MDKAKAHPQRANFVQFRSRLRRHFNMTPDQYDMLYAAQQGQCAICAETIPQRGKGTHVDHDHTTGKVRALLCRACNIGLGHFRDSADRLRLAANYVAFHTKT